MKSDFLEALASGVLVFDGAMGTELQNRDLAQEDYCLASLDHPAPEVREAKQRLGPKVLDGCSDIISLTRPDVIEDIHFTYLSSGANLIETNTFGASAIVLAEYDVPALDRVLSFESARIARRAIERCSQDGTPRFAVGALGPGTKLVSLGQVTWQQIEDTYKNCTIGLLEGGVDVLLLETLQDLLMAKAALVGAKKAMAETGRKVPMIVQITIEQTGTMLVGSEIGAALNMFEAHPEVVAVGMNCATGPAEMHTYVRYLSQNSTRPISIQPNAGLPVMEKGRPVYKLGPADLAAWHTRFVEEDGIAMAGGCCGTTPAHIRATADAVARRPHGQVAHWQRVRHLFPGFDFEIRSREQEAGLQLVGCSSLYQFVAYDQSPSFLIIGEKTNANGSRQFRDMLAAENWEGLVEVARELEGEGSHVLDVCTAFVGRDEVRDMTTLLNLYNKQIQAPIMIDSTEVPVVEASLQSLAGKPIINSINFEDGETRTRRILELCKLYGAAVVALTIDEDGMAKTAEKKVAIAERTLDFTRAYGLPDHDVFFDCLTFTLGSGDEEFRNAAIETINAILELKKRHPRVNTTLGVSNISFGLKPAARQVVNSAFLHYALEAGLTSAIVHFSKILPDNRINPKAWKIASDLVYDRREFANA